MDKFNKFNRCLRSLKRNIIIILTPLFTIIGVIIGAKINHNSNFDLLKFDKLYNYNEKLLEKRIELIERTVKIINKKSDIHLIEKVFDVSLNSLKLADVDEIINNNSNFKNDWETIIKNRFQLFEILNEYAVVMSLNNIYFRDSTQNVIKKFNTLQYWSEIDSTLTQELFNAMYYDVFLYDK